MSNTSPDDNATQGNPSDSTSSDISDIEKKFLRLTFWQTVLSVAAVFTGVVALYAALAESQEVRKQTSAAVWPYVKPTVNDTYDGNTAMLSLTMTNAGVGPARIKYVRMDLDGTVVRDWQSLMERLATDGAVLGIDYGKSSLTQQVLAPGESILAFQTENTDLALKMQDAIYSGSLSLTYCYCSIFDECWNRPGGMPEAEESIQPIAQCPSLDEESFRD